MTLVCDYQLLRPYRRNGLAKALGAKCIVADDKHLGARMAHSQPPPGLADFPVARVRAASGRKINRLDTEFADFVAPLLDQRAVGRGDDDKQAVDLVLQA